MKRGCGKVEQVDVRYLCHYDSETRLHIHAMVFVAPPYEVEEMFLIEIVYALYTATSLYPSTSTQPRLSLILSIPHSILHP